MGTKRPNNQQMMLPFAAEEAGEARRNRVQGVEVTAVSRATESPAKTTDVSMEAICRPENLSRALRRVQANKGGPGVDGMTVALLPAHLKAHWPQIREQLLSGTYKPQPVKRVEIEKPEGGVRKLGIPTVLDRFIQQAILQAIGPTWERTFSEHSHGFRPGRSAHQAVAEAQKYIAEGRDWVVDLDLEKFFDRVNHDRLMAALAGRIADKRLLKLIRAFLNAGVMENGLVSPTKEGAPQGGPLSPLLSNIVLDELDKELERRGHAFVRYADDCNIYVRSERAGQRTMKAITDFIERKLKLKVNQSKSAVDRPVRRKFLGFSFTSGKETKRRIAPKSIARFKERVRELTRRTRGIDAQQMVEELTVYLRGWIGYFGHCETPSVLEQLDGWIRRRLRAVAWKQWRHSRRRRRELVRRGVDVALASYAAIYIRHPWAASRDIAMSSALPASLWKRLGLLSLRDAWSSA
jgi:RNA-directed DNA polymerase